jgi:hypothetical protein
MGTIYKNQSAAQPWRAADASPLRGGRLMMQGTK